MNDLDTLKSLIATLTALLAQATALVAKIAGTATPVPVHTDPVPRVPLKLSGLIPPPWAPELGQYTPNQYGAGTAPLSVLMALYSYVNNPDTPITYYNDVRTTSGWGINAIVTKPEYGDKPYSWLIARYLNPNDPQYFTAEELAIRKRAQDDTRPVIGAGSGGSAATPALPSVGTE